MTYVRSQFSHRYSEPFQYMNLQLQREHKGFWTVHTIPASPSLHCSRG